MKKHFLYFILILISGAIFISCNKDENKPTVLTAAGDIQSTLDEYRSMLGTNNGSTVGSQPSGRRELNWDGVPDSLSDLAQLLRRRSKRPLGRLSRHRFQKERKRQDGAALSRPLAPRS